jgi:hypothetical protein
MVHRAEHHVRYVGEVQIVWELTLSASLGARRNRPNRPIVDP